MKHINYVNTAACFGLVGRLQGYQLMKQDDSRNFDIF